MTKTYVPTRAENSKMTASVSMVTQVKCCKWMLSLNKCWVVLWVVFGLMFTAGIKQLSAMQPPLQSVGGDSYVKWHSFVKLFITTVSHEGKESRLFDKKPLKFNSVWLPLVDVVEYSVVFAPKVFVQSFGVSCHCGLQSTVVHSRVRHCSRGDLQMNTFLFLCFVNVSWEIRNSWMNQSVLCDVEQELWSGSLVLSVPLDISDRTLIFTGQVDVSSLCNTFFSIFWLYAVHGTHGCKMSHSCQLVCKRF